jgi:hypothetical protein
VFPIVFVTLGLGSVIASAISAAPWLAVLSRHKGAMFSGAGLLLSLNYWLVVVRPRRCAPGDVCHVDSPLMRVNRRVWWVSTAVYVIALVLTYGALFVLQRS